MVSTSWDICIALFGLIYRTGTKWWASVADDTYDREALSKREHQIAEGYSAGQTYRDIAEQLFITSTTVKTHLRTVYRKLGVISKVALYQALRSSESANANVARNVVEHVSNTAPHGTRSACSI